MGRPRKQQSPALAAAALWVPSGRIKFRHIYRVDQCRPKQVHGWLLNIKRKGTRLQKWYSDHGDPIQALTSAIRDRDAFLRKATPPYWIIRPSVSKGVFERTRGRKRVVTVHVPVQLQKEIGHDAIDHTFDPTDKKDRALTWQIARQLRRELVEEALKRFPKQRASKRWRGKRI